MNKMNTSEIVDMLTYYYIENNNESLGNQSIERAKDIIKELATVLDGKIKPSELEDKCYNNTLGTLSSIYLS